MILAFKKQCKHYNQTLIAAGEPEGNHIFDLALGENESDTTAIESGGRTMISSFQKC